MTSISRALPLTIATAFLMEGIDSSVVNTALPAMAHDFGTSPAALAISITSYLISLAAFMPLGGWLSDRYGGRQVFVSALAVFAAGSLLCGLAPGVAWLTAGRIVQGMGGAMMAPVGRAILMGSVPKSDYVRVMSYVVTPALVGPAIGPLVGGMLATYVSWRWIFLINLPLAVLGVAMSYRFIPADVAEGDGRPKPLDWIGYGYLVVALCLGQGAIEIVSHGGLAPEALAAIALSAASGFLFVRRYRRLGSGVLDLALLRVRTFRLSVTAGSVARAGLGGMPFLLPLLLQVGFGYDPLQSGLVTFLVAVGAVMIKPVMSLSLRWLGCRRLVLLNSVATVVGSLGFLMFRDKASLPFMPPYVFVFGLLRSAQISAMNALSFTDIEKPQMARASTLSTLSQRLSMGVGVSVSAMVLKLASHGPRPDLNAFAVAFVAVAFLVLIAGAMFMELHPADGWQVSNREPADPKARSMTA